MGTSCSQCAPEEASVSPFWDRLGIGLSTVCLIHCLSLPVLASGIAVWAAIDLHFWLALLIVPVALGIGWHAHRTHRHRWVGPLLLGGCVLLVGALVLEPIVGHTIETGIAAVGGLLLITGHWLNIRS